MRTIKYSWILLLGSILIFSCSGPEQSDLQSLTQFVDPFIGTAGHGHTFPGATLPFAMVQLSPDNNHEGWDWCSGYHSSWDTIAGFSHTHLSGTGVGDLMDITFLPTTREVVAGPDFMNKYYAPFSHDNEIAGPGYYSVILDDGIRAELTTTSRSGFHRYTFPENRQAIVLIDLSSRISWDKLDASGITIENNQLITGYRFSSGWTPGQTVYFAARFSVPFNQAKLISPDGDILVGQEQASSENSMEPVRAMLNWDAPDNKMVLIKVGISSASIKGALNNLDTENAGWDFEEVRNQADETWNKLLNQVPVKSDNTALKRIFYTALYHSYLAPNLYSDVDYQYNNTKNEKQRAADHHMFYTFSLWDTFRAWHPLMTILEPGMVKEFLKAMLAHYNDYGLLPKWNLWGNETYCMIGYHSIPVIVDAWTKGLADKNETEALYDAMISAATGKDETKRYEGLDLYMEYGYMPEDIVRTWWEDGHSHSQSASQTMEWAYDDWCIAQMARGLGRNADFESFMHRSESIKNLFDPVTKLIRPRNSDGSWVTPFDPGSARHGNGFTEGNSWQYSWFYPHSVYEFIKLMGGNEVFATRLDTLFDYLSANDIQFSDVTGLIGQYAHGNEPSHHIAYLYNYAGQPWKTQEKVTEIMNTMYTGQRDGLCGNEDCGQMSAWYVFSAMGLYPVNPCGGVYVFGRPFFDEMTIQLEEDRKVHILAVNLSDENIYVQQVLVNGKDHRNFWIKHEPLMSGCEIKFIMGDHPNKMLWADSEKSPI